MGHRGAVEFLGVVGRRTASGLRTQQVEIKYKKPTERCSVQCGAGVTK
jgi:hypothetical protein